MCNVNSFRFLHWNILKLHKTATNKISHIKKVSDVISTLNPNIASLCEVSNLEELEIIAKLQKTRFTSHFVKSTDTRTGQNCGLITTFKPIVEPHIFSKKISKHFVSQFSIGKIKFALIGCHLISNPQSETNVKQRELQAFELKLQVDSLVDSGFEVILAGDINDFDNNIKDTSSSRSISNVVDIIKCNNNLMTISNFIRKSNRYTFQFEGNNVMLDHIFVTPRMHKLIKNVKIHHIKEKTIDDSDHDPIIIDFNV
jgi:exonuclease III